MTSPSYLTLGFSKGIFFEPVSLYAALGRRRRRNWGSLPGRGGVRGVGGGGGVSDGGGGGFTGGGSSGMMGDVSRVYVGLSALLPPPMSLERGRGGGDGEPAVVRATRVVLHRTFSPPSSIPHLHTSSSSSVEVALRVRNTIHTYKKRDALPQSRT